MSISPELKKYVDNGDLVQIRCYLANYLIVDRTFALFDESLAFASARLPVIQEHDGSILEQDKTLWNREYLNKQIVAAFSNFSKERISHIKEIVSFIAGQNDSLRSTESHSVHRPIGAPKTGRTVVGEEEVSTIHSMSEGKRGHSHESGMPEGSICTARTGRRVIEEKKAEGKATTTGQNVSASHRSETNDIGASSSRTGRRVISETETEKKTDEDPVSPSTSGQCGVGVAMIVGGVALAAVGLAVVKPVVIGAGVAVAGIGIAAKASNNRK